MFAQVTKYCLWDLMPEQVQYRDLQTEQMLYEGEKRGQTQRYSVILGDTILDLFQKIAESFAWKDAFKTEDRLLEFLQREFYARFVIVTPENELLVRNIIDEMISAWRLKGTTVFLHWIVWKIFNWEVIRVVTLASVVLKLSVNSSFLYNPDFEEMQHKWLYDPSFMTPEDESVIIIDVFNDPQFVEKDIILKALLKEWQMPLRCEYLNMPV